MEANKKFMVGLFVAGTLLLFALGLFLIGNSTQLFTKSFQVKADFSKVTGLQVGSKVRVAGMDAGAITMIEVPSHPSAKFRVHVRIIETMHPIVRQDSIATIQTDGLLGNKFLEVDAGTEGSQLAMKESLIQSKEPFDWTDLIDQMSETVKTVNVLMAGVKDEVLTAVANISDTAKSANLLIKTATPHVRGILESSNRISANIREISDGVREGRGAVGALFNDEQLAEDVKTAVRDTGKAVKNLRETSESAKKIVAKVEDSEIVPEVRKTIQNMEQITRQVKEAVDKFQSASGEGGVAENLQRALADAHEAMSDLSEDTEALKHNFLFRGYFKKRGFFDLTSINAPEYKDGKFAKGFERHRAWIESADLFGKDGKGVEVISESGKRKLDAAMAEILRFPRNGPLIVEGYASEGDPSEQYLQARRRAVRVQAYITERFHLRPAYVGSVVMGAVPVDGKKDAGFLDGVKIVSYFKK